MDKFDVARSLERLAAKLRKEAEFNRRLATDETELYDGSASAYESASREVMKIADDLYGSNPEDRYREARRGIKAFVHAGQPWPLTDAVMERILAEEDQKVLAEEERKRLSEGAKSS